MPGPNSVTGHTSTVFAIENAINYSLRIIKPLLDGEAVSIDCSQEAEARWDRKIQDGLQKTVWADGNCTNWYSRDAEGKQSRNSSTYPFTQGHFWYKCVFPDYEDLKYSVSCYLPRSHRTLLLTGFISLPSTAEQRDSVATSRLPSLHLRSLRLSRRCAPSGKKVSRMSSKATLSKPLSSFTCSACASGKRSDPSRDVDVCQKYSQVVCKGLGQNVNHVILHSADFNQKLVNKNFII